MSDEESGVNGATNYRKGAQTIESEGISRSAPLLGRARDLDKGEKDNILDRERMLNARIPYLKRGAV